MRILGQPRLHPTPPYDGERDSLVGLYFKDASRYDLLSETAERRLAKRLIRSLRIIHAELAMPEDTPPTLREAIGSLGDLCAFSPRFRRAYRLAMACRERLIQSNLRLAVHIARRYGHYGIPMSDLIQDANVGLIKAVERYDPSKGFRFSTYAYWWISEEVQRCLQRGMRVVHTPENVVEEIRRLQKVSMRLHQSLGREPTQSELAHEMEATPSRVGQLRALASREVSTDVPLVEDGSFTLADRLDAGVLTRPDQPFQARDRMVRLERMLSELSDRERDILTRRYGLGLIEPDTLQTISEQIGLSRERVRQIEKSALRKLQALFGSNSDGV
ncbi:RNA polymerase sigma factor RpoD/SigA [Marinobacter sp. AL4B]|uniref:sigma-70 family RNA polymerase sigma factor n=1 Tax=Marinobacter sp. AL4B TaxID=2871173 RepID=UPI001CAA5197|nr:RNA polymerase sigma factor RpoD/SigA [Marinobacter sp. AL4B]MBZ0335472.1 RNA polymerase sigma factor RpoD/SigA [Marinobacter sp. AL4B]